MKVGMGIRGALRTDESYLQFLRQIGVSHCIVFMPDDEIFSSAKYDGWSVDDLLAIKKLYASHALTVEGFENFDPKIWYKILLDEPGKEKQMEYIKTCIRNMGRAGIPIMGYNFSIGCVTGHVGGPFARGGARTVRYIDANVDHHDALPLGWAWNTRVVDDAPEGRLPFVSRQEMKARRDWFLEQIVPVAEEAGVQMAAHPEDPPVPVLKNAGRVLISPEDYEEMFRQFPSDSVTAEFCQGTFTEMGVDVYATIESLVKRNKISYVHFRNTRGALPDYTEVFIDEGDVDMVRALKVYRDNGYTGLFMPDHTPTLDCQNTSETGMAYAVGYIRGILKALDVELVY